MLGEIKIDHECLIVLKKTLLAVSPEEGCALLLGEQISLPESRGSLSQHIRFIWPCCNVWGNQNFLLHAHVKQITKNPSTKISKKNRFFLDPREQIRAQQWARKKNWFVLGTCHSHLHGPAIPSKTDTEYTYSENLMLILASNGHLRAWWMTPNRHFEERTLVIIKH